MGISAQTFHQWKKAYGSLAADQVPQLRQLQDENARLKKRVAEFSCFTTLDDVRRMIKTSRTEYNESRPPEFGEVGMMTASSVGTR